MELLQAEAPATAGKQESHHDLACRILDIIFAQRRLLPGETGRDTPSESDQPASGQCSASLMMQSERTPHLPKVRYWIERGEPINLVLPAFPAKSPSRRKTLGHLPDLGEELAFSNLCQLCDEIGRVHAPGAKVIICSDGRVFADVVRIPDEDVTAYNDEMRRYAKAQGMHQIEFFDLDDVYPNVKDFGMLREDLMVMYGESLASLRERCRTDAAAGEMYRGITRFMVEDFSGIPAFAGMSRNALQNAARLAAYRVIQRSNAWGRLLAQHLPHAVRLSIHPQFRVSEKIGIRLVDGTDCWATPWHSVVLKQGEQVSLVPRARAEQMNAALIFRNGRPSHFQMLA